MVGESWGPVRVEGEGGSRAKMAGSRKGEQGWAADAPRAHTVLAWLTAGAAARTQVRAQIPPILFSYRPRCKSQHPLPRFS